MKNRNGKTKRLKPAIECRLTLFDEYDRPLVTAIREQAKRNERTIIQEIKFRLRTSLELHE
jgi:hypothetical protein